MSEIYYFYSDLGVPFMEQQYLYEKKNYAYNN